MEEIRVFDIAGYLHDGAKEEAVLRECSAMAEHIHQTGILIIRDPRVSFEDNERFISTMERYFNQPDELKKDDAHPEHHYQVGVTPEFTEVPRCASEPDCLERIKKMPEEDRAHPPQGPDPKERFFWRMGELPADTEFPALNAPAVIPRGFPEWEDVMNTWGNKMLTAVSTVAEMLALGFGFPANTFVDKMKFAPHLLAPTGTNLAKYGTLDTVYAGYHYDLNFMTIHGKSKFPGLYIWLRSGKKHSVKVPDGCLLIQAGKQMEHTTGGYVQAGYHEVVCNAATLEAIEKAKHTGTSQWRVSSTLFSHFASDSVLEPLGKFAADEEVRKRYPTMKTGHQVQAELDIIKLASPGKLLAS